MNFICVIVIYLQKMKITLKNFRCYKDKVFDFSKNGVILISGPSGKGKTTILEAISFVLFGTGTKVVMYGKTSCIVTIEFEDLKVSRSKRPNRLIVNDIYEDDAGQEIINKKFGNSFETTGYISQNSNHSFILMSPIEKLNFLEKFAFQDIDLFSIKKRCKDLIKERNDTLLKISSALETVSLLKDEIENPEKIDFPIKCSKKNREKIINNEKIKLKNSTILIKRCNSSIRILDEELKLTEINNINISCLEERIEANLNKLKKLKSDKDIINFEGDSSLKKHIDMLNTLLSRKELLIIEKKYTENNNSLIKMKDEETTNILKQIQDIEKDLWVEYNNDEINENISEYKQIIKDLETIEIENSKLKNLNLNKEELIISLENLEKKLETLKQNLDDKKNILIKLERQKELYNCPSCNEILKFQDDKLHIYDKKEQLIFNDDIENIKNCINNFVSEIKITEKNITNIKNNLLKYNNISNNITNIKNQYDELPNIEEIKNDLDYMLNYKSTNKEKEKILNTLKLNIKNSNFSVVIKSFENDVIKTKKRLDSLKKDITLNTENEMINEEELREKISQQKLYKNNIEMLNKNIKILEEDNIKFNLEIEEINENFKIKYGQKKDIDTIKKELLTKESELKNLEMKQKESEISVDKIQKYLEYEKKKEKHLSWLEKIKNLSQEEKEKRKEYGAAITLKEKILESESIAMFNIISSINTHTQTYLDCFFPDEPISVKLLPFKDPKKNNEKKKPQINLYIEYKGMEADINMLSGGELSRVILSFALALGEMFNTPLMMLDECTASLDQEMTDIVMDGIRENFNGKMVIIIAHQIIEGSFDQVIKL